MVRALTAGNQRVIFRRLLTGSVFPWVRFLCGERLRAWGGWFLRDVRYQPGRPWAALGRPGPC